MSHSNPGAAVADHTPECQKQTVGYQPINGRAMRRCCGRPCANGLEQNFANNRDAGASFDVISEVFSRHFSRRRLLGGEGR